MNCGRDFCIARRLDGACLSGEDPRGARDWAHLRATDLYSVGSLGPDHDAVMRIGGKLRGRAHSLSRHQCHVRIRRPATSDRQFGSRLKSQRERRVGKGMLFRAFSLPDAG
jgi:hypothetical protein